MNLSVKWKVSGGQKSFDKGKQNFMKYWRNKIILRETQNSSKIRQNSQKNAGVFEFPPQSAMSSSIQ